MHGRDGHTGLDALPDIHTATFGIPSAALRRKGPVYIDVPDCSCIFNDGCGHCCGLHERRIEEVEEGNGEETRKCDEFIRDHG